MAVLDELIMAARDGELEELQRLLGMYPELINTVEQYEGWTILHLAAFKGRKEVVALALDRGARINKRIHPERVTALFYACEANQFEVANLLLERGADPTIPSSFSHTPLISRINNTLEEGSLGLIQNLIRHTPIGWLDQRSDVGRTALFYAIKRDRTEIMKMLLDAGADPHVAPDNDGYTCMDVARYLTARRSIRLLQVSQMNYWG